MTILAADLRPSLGRAVLCTLLLVASSASAHAIPSPELIVSSLSSVSQLWGLAGAVAGGGALAMGARSGQAGATEQKLRRWLMILAAVAAAMTILDIVQFVNARTERTARLEAALVRPTPKRPDGATLDPSLREMPYSAQLQSPQGVTTDEVAIVMGEVAAGRATNVIALDIRETLETEQGGMAGARTVRFPDLAASGIDFTGKTALLFCHNGNRSAETCAKLAALGIDCRFMVGGFEKWLVEGRTLAGSGARTLADLRAIASYPHQTTLLDTAQAKRLVADEGAVFVDVRYGGEFESGHLPGAISLPIRPTPSPELARRLDSLPDAPIIVPCYDRRSCFYGDVLGLELARRGRDYRGRYSVPWEYFEPSLPPPHVAAWLKSANVTVYGHAALRLADGLDRAAASLGLAGAIVALALLSRLLVWPLAAKADRDQKVARIMAPDVAALKARLRDDPQRLTRAMKALLRRHKLTPARNLLALGFLPVLALSIEAVGQVALRHSHEGLAPLTWIGDGAAVDPSHALPSAFGVLLACYLHASLAQSRAARLVVWVVAAPALAALAAQMPALANLYMVASAALLLAQRWIASWNWRAVGAAIRRVRLAWARFWLMDKGLRPLADVAGVAACGNKAARLAAMAEIGVRVPSGVVLTGAFLANVAWRHERHKQRALNAIWRRLGARRVAVRSSAGSEDGTDASFAGVFETVLDVDRAGLARAIERVAASFKAARVGAYAKDAGSANILIQPMVAARHAGVVFTQDPAVPGCGLIEWVAGNGEALVSGQATPQSARAGRLTGEIDFEAAPPFDLAALWAVARRIEARFGSPQDIEWAHDGRAFVILQARDIVPGPTGPHTAIADEWQRLALMAQPCASGSVLSVDGMAELLPCPTPASLALLNAFWAGGGSMDLAARSLGFDAPRFDGDHDGAAPLYVTAFGALYAHQRERDSRALAMTPSALRRLRAQAQTLERDLRATVLPQIAAQAIVRDAVDPARLSTPALIALFAQTARGLVTQTHVAVDRVNIAAQVFLDEARAALAACGENPAEALADVAPAKLARGLARLASQGFSSHRHALQSMLGHRGLNDYELAAPRYGESRTALVAAAEQLAAAALMHRGGRSRGLRHLPSGARQAVIRAQRFVTLKEDAKHEGLRDVAVLRRLMLEIDQRFGLGGVVFHLTLDEVGRLSAATLDPLAALAEVRYARLNAFKAAPSLPLVLTARDIELGPLAALRRARPASYGAGHVVQSSRVSGSGPVEGRAICVARHICESGAPIPGFEAGDIIVARAMNPAWLPQMMACGGVVVETGGWLSHMAILARERGLAMSVGARGIDAIQTGQRLRLEADGAVVCL